MRRTADRDRMNKDGLSTYGAQTHIASQLDSTWRGQRESKLFELGDHNPFNNIRTLYILSQVTREWSTTKQNKRYGTTVITQYLSGHLRQKELARLKRPLTDLQNRYASFTGVHCVFHICKSAYKV